MATKHKVVITGIGLVTPVGADTQSTWHGLLAGRSGLSRATDPVLQNYHATIMGVVNTLPDQLDAILSKKNQTKTDRFIHLALMAGQQALADAGLSNEFPQQRERFGAYVGVGIGGLESIGNGAQMLAASGPRSLSPFLIPKSINNLAANWLSMQWNLQGPSFAITSACSSGSDAVGAAFRAIRDGYADYMLAGGTESCTIPLAMVAFGNMRTLSTWPGDPAGASRPFDKNRTGFVLAEGAGMLLLEREDLARKRGATCYAEVVGYGGTSDAYHMTAMHPEGQGAVNAIKAALADAGVDRSAIGYVNAHGTGTPMNDAVETMVLKKVFDHYLDVNAPGHILVSSTKSMTGHMIGAAGGAEIGFTALALKNQIVPPTINLDEPDPACDLDYVAHHARETQLDYAMSNAFGFGGGNSVVVLKKVI